MKITNGNESVELTVNEVNGNVDIVLRKPGSLEEYRSFSAADFIEVLKNYPVEKPWASEYWLEGDLIGAIESNGIDATPERIETMKEKCADIFYDKSKRNEMLSDAAYDLFC